MQTEGICMKGRCKVWVKWPTAVMLDFLFEYKCAICLIECEEKHSVTSCHILSWSFHTKRNESMRHLWGKDMSHAKTNSWQCWILHVHTKRILKKHTFIIVEKEFSPSLPSHWSFHRLLQSISKQCCSHLASLAQSSVSVSQKVINSYFNCFKLFFLTPTIHVTLNLCYLATLQCTTEESLTDWFYSQRKSNASLYFYGFNRRP